jgi:hypothetical protein
LPKTNIQLGTVLAKHIKHGIWKLWLKSGLKNSKSTSHLMNETEEFGALCRVGNGMQARWGQQVGVKKWFYSIGRDED